MNDTDDDTTTYVDSKEMEHFYYDMSDSIYQIRKLNINGELNSKIALASQVWSKKEREHLLRDLSKLLLLCNESQLKKMNRILGPLIIDLLYRLSETMDKSWNVEKHEKICIILSWLTKCKVPLLNEFVHYYLHRHGAPFQKFLQTSISNGEEDDNKADVRAKRRKTDNNDFSRILEATNLLVIKYPYLLKLNWKWSALVSNAATAHLCLSCSRASALLDRLIGFLRGKIPQSVQSSSLNAEEEIEIEVSNHLHYDYLDEAEVKENVRHSAKVSTKNEVISHVKLAVTSADLSRGLVAICGVLLPRYQHQNQQEVSPPDGGRAVRIMTRELQRVVRIAAVSISQGESLLIHGPSGCGKTSLVEYFADKTGRSRAPHFSKIQLSDDTDSKTLTGTYVSTSVPGKFQWQEGILVEACMKGYWILLEDIDRAPMDVISLLLPLIESRSLHIPGRSTDQIDVSPGFRLFMTLRGETLSHEHGVTMVASRSRVLQLRHVADKDLQVIISKMSPAVANITHKLVEIYAETRETISENSFSVRKPSTRDIMKWAGRINKLSTTNNNPEDYQEQVLLSALDCFIAPIADTKLCRELITNICPKLNIPRNKAQHYCKEYKPEISRVRLTTGKRKLVCGRYEIEVNKSRATTAMSGNIGFGETRLACLLMERLVGSVIHNEPVLLVGETGVGKTTALQYLAQETGNTLHVMNMSQQSSSSDLLGGYKPIEIKHIVRPIVERFQGLLLQSDRVMPDQFVAELHNCMVKKRYKDLYAIMNLICISMTKVKTVMENLQLLRDWKSFSADLKNLEIKLKSESPVAFHFVQGQLATCMQSGEWLLLDEINLASSETLECLSGILESAHGSVVLLEKGDSKPIERHPNFRIFAAMNPATDVGKRQLTEGCRNRFTETYVDEPRDLHIIVEKYLSHRVGIEPTVINAIVKFYKKVCKLSPEKLTSGFGKKPHYSLRTLCRALQFVVDSKHLSLGKAIYEGFCLSFLTGLERRFHHVIIDLIKTIKVSKSRNQAIDMSVARANTIEVKGHYVARGSLTPFTDEKYIETDSVKENLRLLARPVAYGKFPVLIEGATSTGKTSLIGYLGKLTGNKIVRINNHEHTDLQEYLGSYASDSDGRLVFHDGPLVTAMKEGHWIILDELNLAPTDILEALNRVLDDNRELFIPETQENIHAHPKFMLFATQNPPGMYGGRKLLSRAFRNRFIELKFGEIETKELVEILHRRCQLAKSDCDKLVNTMLDLQAARKKHGLAGRDGFITLRDLFKWADRYSKYHDTTEQFYDWGQHLADDGFLLLAGRVRKPQEEQEIEDILFKNFKRKIKRDELFGMDAIKRILELNEDLAANLRQHFPHVVWTQPMRRMFITLERALRFNEPALLVGETGGGKTTVCQMIAATRGRTLQVVNCHSNTEAADFIGGLRPARHEKSSDATDGDDVISDNKKLFEWNDGPLVSCMLKGEHLLIDEISLADDSVLERLNSVLETDRKLNVPDRIVEDGRQEITADEDFKLTATQNPGGDYGKKELSPALRNRMTEIWCPVDHDPEDLRKILSFNLCFEEEMDKSKYANLIVQFVMWFKSTTFGKRFIISVRDLLTWCNFMNATVKYLEIATSYLHAACLVYIDGLGAGVSGSFARNRAEVRVECLKFLKTQLRENGIEISAQCQEWMDEETRGIPYLPTSSMTSHEFAVGPFSIPRKNVGDVTTAAADFTFQISTTALNAMRCLRALCLRRPLLLEGSPGCGKTSLVAALAKIAGSELVRINLSEQTDISDLFGADLPVEDGLGGQFSWRDGPLLSAMKSGHWVVLDELNLAPQAVLEGLNGIFDHRGEIYVPELGKTFKVDAERTKIFACQNPQAEGGGRKGLPKSFLNRFTQVYMSDLRSEDLKVILRELKVPDIADLVLDKMLNFHQKICGEIIDDRLWAHLGFPWELNLRDLQRWCHLILSTVSSGTNEMDAACQSIYLIFAERMRTEADRNKMLEIAEEIFGHVVYRPNRTFMPTQQYIQIGNTRMSRKPMMTSHFDSERLDDVITPEMLHPMESIATALNQKWPCLVTCSDSRYRRSVISSLATLSGNRLMILSTNSSMDAIELLGGFEQNDNNKKIAKFLHELSTKLLSGFTMHTSTAIVRVLRVVEKLRSCQALLTGNDYDVTDESSESLWKQLDDALTSCEQLSPPEEICDLMRSSRKFVEIWRREQMEFGSFEWNDSVLVESLKNGHWLLIDEANLCSASVLDRMNSLLEENGKLFITERGVVDGDVISVTPHPDFRLILAMSPSSGELSRAMRNRCVEINILMKSPPSHDDDVMMPAASTASRGDDVETLLLRDGAREDDEWRLQLHRRGLTGCHGDDDDVINPVVVHVQQPTVRDDVISPQLTNVIRNFKFFEQWWRESGAGDDATDHLMAYLQVAAEMATPGGWKFYHLVADRVLGRIFAKHVDGRLSQLQLKSWLAHLKSVTRNLYSGDVEYDPNLPFDDRWNPSLRQTTSTDQMMTSSSAYIAVTSSMLEKEESLELEKLKLLVASTNASEVKAKFFTRFSPFYLSMVFEKLRKGKDSVKFLKHLKMLHRDWEKILEKCLQDLQLMCDEQVEKFEGVLINIFHLWRQLMTSQYDLSTFVVQFTKLTALITQVITTTNQQDESNHQHDVIAFNTRVRNTKHALHIQDDVIIREAETRDTIRERMTRGAHPTARCRPGASRRALLRRCAIMWLATGTEFSQNWDSDELVRDLLATPSGPETLLMTTQTCAEMKAIDDVVPVEEDAETTLEEVIVDHQLADYAADYRHELRIRAGCHDNTATMWTREVAMARCHVQRLVTPRLSVATVRALVGDERRASHEISLRGSRKVRQRATEVIDLLDRNSSLLRHYRVTDDVSIPPFTHRCVVLLMTSLRDLMRVCHQSLTSFNVFAQISALSSANCGGGDIGRLVEQLNDSLVPSSGDTEEESAWTTLLTATITSCWEGVGRILTLIQGGNDISMSSSIKRKFWQLEILAEVGSAWVWCGKLHYVIIMPSRVDPVLRHQIHIQVVSDEISKRKHYLNARAQLACALTGDDDVIKDHPRIVAIEKRVEELEAKLADLNSKVKVRESKEQFKIVSELCDNFFTDKLDHAEVEELRSRLLQIVTNEETSPEFSLKDQKEKMLKIFDPIIHALRDTRFDSYDDVTRPVIDAIHQVKFGFEILLDSAQIGVVTSLSADDVMTYEELMTSLVHRGGLKCDNSDDAVDVTSLLDSMTSHFSCQVECSKETSKPDSSSAHHVENLLRIFLSRIRLNAVSYGIVNEREICQIYQIIKNKWQEKLDYQQQKEKEEDSLYHYKPKVIEDELTDEEHDKMEMDRILPCFSMEEEEDNLGENVKNTKPDDVTNGIDNNDDDDWLLSDDFFRSAAQTFADVMAVAGGEKMAASSPPSAAITADLLFSHRFVSEQMERDSAVMRAGTVDRDMLLPNLLVAGDLRNSLTCCDVALDIDEVMTSSSSKGQANVYVDAVPGEVQLALPILDKMTMNVAKLLDEFNEEPNLLRIVQMIARIGDFPVTSPLMRFTMGLEALLRCSQIWQERAHKGIKLTEDLERISELVLKWRKMELKSWYGLLDTVEKDARFIDPKWWFFVQDAVHDCCVPTVASGGDDDKGSEEEMKGKMLKLASALQHFIENSNLLQFEEKLRLVRIVSHFALLRHHDTGDAETECCVRKVRHLLANLLGYYAQFTEACRSRVTLLRSKVEKELKDFIAINKWKDLNHHAREAKTKKDHKTLFKFVKKYRNEVRHEQISVKILNNSAPASLSTEQSDAHNSATRAIFLQWKESCAMTSPEATTSSPVSKVEKYSREWKKEKNEIWISQLEENEDFAGEIMDNLKELSKLLPPLPPPNEEDEKDIERKRRLQEAKLIQSQKRNALSELFRLLKKSGLSYRLGMMEKKQMSSSDLMNLPCVPDDDESRQLGDDLGHLRNLLAQTCPYFYKTLTRWTMFASSMTTPSKELAVEELHRMKGFTNNLLQIVAKQRTQLAHVTTMTSYVSRLSHSIREISSTTDDDVVAYVDQRSVAKEMQTTRNHVINLLHSIDLVRPCFDLPTANTRITSPDCGSVARLSGLRDTGELLLVELQKLMDGSLLVSQANHSTVTKPGVLFSHRSASDIRRRVDSFMTSATHVCSELCDVIRPKRDDEQQCRGESPLLVDLMTSLREMKRKVVEAREEIGGDDVIYDDVYRNVKERLQELDGEREGKVSIKLVVQDLWKNLEKQKQEKSGDDSEQKMSLSHEGIFEEAKHLRMTEIRKCFDDVIAGVITLSRDSINNSEMISEILKEMEVHCGDYLSLLTQVNIHTCAVHRCSCKLLSVLTVVFSQVFTKGFCPPTEFEKELEEGADKGQLKDVEDCGIGAGEGNKDVSDQIENEEQVEDAPGEEEEEQDQGGGDIPEEDNAIEMSEDFSGQMHDPDQKEEDQEEESGDEDEDEPEQKMGDLGDNPDEPEKLDERMWGSDDEDDDPESREDKKEEKGSGEDQEKSELGSKDKEVPDDEKEQDKPEDPKDDKKDDEEEEEEKEAKDMIDESEYDPEEK